MTMNEFLKVFEVIFDFLKIPFLLPNGMTVTFFDIAIFGTLGTILAAFIGRMINR